MKQQAQKSGRPPLPRLEDEDIAFIKKQVEQTNESKIFVAAQFHREVYEEAIGGGHKGLPLPSDVESVKSAFDGAFKLDRKKRDSLPELYYRVLESLYGIERNSLPSRCAAPQTHAPDDEIAEPSEASSPSDLASKSGRVSTPTTPGPQQPDGDLPASLDSSLSRRTQAEIFGDQMFDDYLTGLGLAEWSGSLDALESAINLGRQRLKLQPDDLYCRGMLLWSVLTNGNPHEMVEFLNETARWLDAPPATKAQSNFPAWRKKIEEKIQQIKKGTAAVPGYERWFLEDTLARVTLLRSLKFQGQSSRLRREFLGLGSDLGKQFVMKALFELTESQRGDSWVGTAVAHANRWADFELESGLARLCLLWFTGRKREPISMQFAIEQSCRWLDRNPDQTLVRWATLWLAGLCPEGEIIDRLIDQTLKWLQTESSADKHLVWMGCLWLVGARGNSAHVQQAKSQVIEWLDAHATDDFIRVVFLLFLVRRRCGIEERYQAVAKTRQWLKDKRHPDVYGITDLAVRLCEPAPN